VVRDPLQSRRLWHQYFYLGYDVEPSCKDGDGGDFGRLTLHPQTIRSAP
jgi:hypothetical protein